MPDRRLWRLIVTITVLDLLIVLTGPLIILIDGRREAPGTSRVVVIAAVVAVIVLPLQCIALWKVLQQQFGEQRRIKRLRKSLERVIATSDVEMAFQPIVDVAESRVIGVEALARFPGDTSASADQWFADASSVGLEQELDLLAVRAALAAAVQLPQRLYVAVNVSPATFGSPELLAAIEAASIPADRLVVEVTEHTSIDDYAPLQAARGELQSHGIRLAVDDAGAGYASFRHIVALAPDILKIDRTIVTGIDQDPARSALVASLVMFARDSGISTVAEGVESAGELSCLAELGVQAAQGHLTGMPSVSPEVWASWA